MTSNEVKILVIIPAFNEESAIVSVIDDVRRHNPGADIAVVNDGSSDNTGKIALTRDIILLTHPFNMGIGATVQTGFKYALRHGYDIAVQVDGDGQHPASQIKDILAPILSGQADVVVGSRFLGKGDYRPSAARSAGIAIFSGIVSFILGERFTDTTSGFRATGRKALEFLAFRYPDDYPEVEALVLLHKKRLKITEVPVAMSERRGGASSITPLRSVYYMLKVMLAIFVDLLKKVD